MRTKWTRELIIRKILDRESAGLPLTLSGKNGVDMRLYQAARRIFGSWPNAITAAGIPPGRALPNERWTPARIVMVIRNLSRRKEPLTVAQLEERYGNMVASARRFYGSWPKAVLAAGVDPAKLRRGAVWSRESIIEAILIRVLRGESLRARSIQPRSLVDAAQRIFGSWAGANEAAGIDPHLHQLRPEAVEIELHGKDHGTADHSNAEKASGRSRQPQWTEATVIAGILRRNEQKRRMNTSAVCDEDDNLYRAAMRRFGAWDHALIAAGLDPVAVYRQSLPTKESNKNRVGADPLA